jgi:hypothetical protein
MAEVTKDFDVERTANGAPQQTFTLGGEKFTVRRFVPAEVLAEFGRREVKNFGDTLDAYDKLVKACLEDSDGEKWDKVRREADPPLTLGAVEQVLWWLVDAASGRPTEASSSSRRGRAAQAAT